MTPDIALREVLRDYSGLEWRLLLARLVYTAFHTCGFGAYATNENSAANDSPSFLIGDLTLDDVATLFAIVYMEDASNDRTPPFDGVHATLDSARYNNYEEPRRWIVSAAIRIAAQLAI